MVAVIVKNFRTRPTRPCIAHGPEVIGSRNTDDAIFGKTRDFLPQIECLVVLGIHRRQQFFLRQAEFPGDQVPRQLDGLILEIVAE